MSLGFVGYNTTHSEGVEKSKRHKIHTTAAWHSESIIFNMFHDLWTSRTWRTFKIESRIFSIYQLEAEYKKNQNMTSLSFSLTVLCVTNRDINNPLSTGFREDFIFNLLFYIHAQQIFYDKSIDKQNITMMILGYWGMIKTHKFLFTFS